MKHHPQVNRKIYLTGLFCVYRVYKTKYSFRVKIYENTYVKIQMSYF